MTAKTWQLLAILDQKESQRPENASICGVFSVRNFQLHSLSAFVCICVFGVYFGWHNFSLGHSWSFWLGCACSDVSAKCHTLLSLAVCLTMRTAIFNQTRLICPPLRLVCLPACVATKACRLISVSYVTLRTWGLLCFTWASGPKWCMSVTPSLAVRFLGVHLRFCSSAIRGPWYWYFRRYRSWLSYQNVL